MISTEAKKSCGSAHFPPQPAFLAVSSPGACPRRPPECNQGVPGEHLWGCPESRESWSWSPPCSEQATLPAPVLSIAVLWTQPSESGTPCADCAGDFAARILPGVGVLDLTEGDIGGSGRRVSATNALIRAKMSSRPNTAAPTRQGSARYSCFSTWGTVEKGGKVQPVMGTVAGASAGEVELGKGQGSWSTQTEREGLSGGRSSPMVSTYAIFAGYDERMLPLRTWELPPSVALFETSANESMNHPRATSGCPPRFRYTLHRSEHPLVEQTDDRASRQTTDQNVEDRMKSLRHAVARPK